MKSIHQGEEFWINRSKKEAEEFLDRILDSLLDYLHELEAQCSAVEKIEYKQRSEEQQLFLAHYREVKLGLLAFKEKKRSFDDRYMIAVKIQADLMEMELNSDW